MYWMQYLGLGVLLATLLSGAYFALRTNIKLKRVGLFASLGLFVGVALLFASRITSIWIPLVGEITTKTEQVRADAHEVKGLRREVERQRDEIALVVRDANEARNDLAKLAEITEKAGEKLDAIEQAVYEAEQGLNELNSITEFSMILTKATNDHRQSFDSLVGLSKLNGPFKALAFRAIVEIAHELDLQVRLDPKVRWEKYNIIPDEASFEQWRSVYNRVHPLYRPAFLSQFWQQERFPKHDRLMFLYDIIKLDGSLRTVHRACILMNI